MTIPLDAAAGGCECLPPRRRLERDDPPAERPVNAFVLRYEDRWFGIEKRVAFEAPDLATALAMVEHEPIGRWAELSLDGRSSAAAAASPMAGRVIGSSIDGAGRGALVARSFSRLSGDPNLIGAQFFGVEQLVGHRLPRRRGAQVALANLDQRRGIGLSGAFFGLGEIKFGGGRHGALLL